MKAIHFRDKAARRGRSIPAWPLAAAAACLLTASASADSQPSTVVDYEQPNPLIGNIVPLGHEQQKCLFRSERKATRTDATVQVTCDYTYPDGSLAAHDHIVYRAGHLVSFAEDELQIGEKGSATIRQDPKNAGKQRIYFEYTTGRGAEARTTTASESLENAKLVDEMIHAFIVSHWNELQKGAPEKFRYIVLSRKETVGFKLVKETESTWHGKPVVRIKMLPTSLIIARLVDPVVFVVEKAGQHR